MCETASDARSRDDPESGRGRAAVARRVVRFYQDYVSDLKMAPTCRFEPTCSNYAITALERHGLIIGSWLAFRRLLRCGPWHPGGWDPVPPRRRRSRKKRPSKIPK